MASDVTVATGQKAEEKFRTAEVVSISTGHFIHDSFPAFLSPVLPLLIANLGISMTAAGALVTILRWATLVQPFIGHWADHTDVRYFVIVAPTVTALGMSLIGVAPNYWVIVVLLAVVGLSHAAFHPASSAMVTKASGSTWGKGLSIFMAGGELGRSLGPLYIVAIVNLLGFSWSPIAAIPGILASLLLYFQVGRAPKAVAARVSRSSLWAAVKQQWRPLGLLAGMIFFRSLAATSFATFLPTYYVHSGRSLWFAGIAVTVYEAGGVVGAFLGGTISDRLGRKTVLWLSQVISVPLFYAVLILDTPYSYVALVLAGLIGLSTGPVGLALVQEILPENRAAASGIMLFLGFEGTVISTLLFGFAADIFGLEQSLFGSIFVSLLCLLFTFNLPDYRKGRDKMPNMA